MGRIGQAVTKSRLVVSALIVSMVMLSLSSVSADQVMSRSIAMSNSAGGATNVTYEFSSNALPTSGTPVQSVGIEMCTTPSGACTTPAGFSAAAAALTEQPSGLGAASGWTASSAAAGVLRISNGSNATNPSGVVSISWNGVTNPTNNNTTFYARFITYSDANWTVAIDTGTVALATAEGISVTATVDETLVFCTGTSITGQNCATVSGSSVNLGTLSATTPGTGTSVMAASTNATGGYTITINGTTLTSGGNTIDAITAAAGSASAPGTEQFGVNLRDNATPNVGADPTGDGSFAYGAGYGTVDAFKFVSGETIVSTAQATNASAYTVSYLANIGGATEAGQYSSMFTYVATATF